MCKISTKNDGFGMLNIRGNGLLQVVECFWGVNLWYSKLFNVCHNLRHIPVSFFAGDEGIISFGHVCCQISSFVSREKAFLMFHPAMKLQPHDINDMCYG
jgi:hypothetical protein